ncbi:2-dehydropantoate 2-reductase [Clostridium chromiireducens]|uniref:2-dehydropantoate 2-reductase n=1 Tax=Clostridium chromiireducens TaxID=225345 RepID=A0A1V4J1L4_9CLOT|nr:2-dehydropantoate 2-reductase [Clostridium chromiireducens]OPJ66053.1 2-dehydropantoate 2-reductase [Clostridium chromiireducens]RII36619.1 2-dehydropantoate 2-reductase [Clostridium chromiireducens]
MKIAILGAGAMGNLYGAYLSRCNEVYMIDVNNKIVDSINQKGIVIYEKEANKDIIFPVSSVTDSEGLGIMDLVIVFVKNIYTISAMENNQNIIGENTLVLTLQNGAGNDRDLQQFVNKNNILIGTTEHNCANLEPGRISHNSSGVTNIGMLTYNIEILQKICNLFINCNIDTRIYENIQEIIWNKLFINMSLNSVTAILQCKVGYLHENNDASKIVRNILSEAVDVAIADGTYFNKDEVIEKVEKHIKEDFHEVITSMNQDVKNKRLTEIDHINGAVVRAAKEYNIQTPYNEFIVHLVHAIEGMYGTGAC